MATFSPLDKFGLLFSNPEKLFDSVRDEPWYVSLVYYVLVLLLVSALSYAGVLMLSSVGGRLGLVSSFTGMLWYPINLFLVFAYIGIVHLISMAARTQAPFSSTMKLILYSLVPFLAFSLIPLVGLLSIIYSFVLMVIGGARLHKVSHTKAFMVFVLPAIIIFLILTLLLVLLILSLRSMF